MNDRIVVVTGAHGFIGRHVSRYFALQGWQVIGMGHGNWSDHEWKNWGMREWHECDITVDTLSVYAKTPEVILHCAGSGLVSYSMTHPFQDYERTVVTTLSVLEFIRLKVPQARFVYPSSAAVYGIADQFPMKEDFPRVPVSMYGLNKKTVEDYCLAYAKHFNVAISIVRLFSVYGPGLRKQLLWDACSKAHRNDLEFSGTGKETRDLIHIEDAVKLLFTAKAYSSAKCPVVNGGFGNEVTVEQILKEIFILFSKTESPHFSGKVRAGDPLRYRADISSAKTWGWEPHIFWRNGIQNYVEWFKKEAL